MPKHFFYEIKINESHLDTFGHVNNAVYLQLYEQARWEFITENGMGLSRIQQEQIGPILIELTVKYIKEIRNREIVTIESFCREIRGSRLILEQIIYNQDKEKVSQGQFVCVVFDMVKRRPLLPTADWLRAVGVEEGEDN